MHKDQEKYVIIITGPTAVGKTKISLQLADRYNAEIFSADSRQLYREMTIGTAKPTAQELATVRHHLINHKSIHDGYSAGDYYRDMENLMESYFRDHDVAIVSGGTGMYIYAIMEGLHEYPDVSQEVLDHIESDLAAGGIALLQSQLKDKDPEYYTKTDINNPRRLVRALSVIQESGETFTSFQQGELSGLPYRWVPIILHRDREELYDRINQRVLGMLKDGLIQEAKSLHEYDQLKPLQTVGYSELMMHFDGLIDIVAATEMIQRNTRRYAKRQLTWWRKKTDWPRFHPNQVEDIMNYIEASINLN